jgi:penicillin amidase
MRINQILRADSNMTVDRMRTMQLDPASTVADYFVPYFLNAAKTIAAHPVSGIDATKLDEAAKLLTEWDRRYTRENTRAVLFEAAFRELQDRTWDELDASDPGSGRTRRVVTPATEILAELLADSSNAWWDDRRTSRHEDRDEILAASLVAALDSTRAHFGDPHKKGWTWSRVRRANIWHPLGIASLSALNLPVQGGRGTLNPLVAAGNFGSSWRMVVEAAPNELKAWGTYPGGQSGNPASSRYKNHIEEWMAGDLEPLIVPKWIPELSKKETMSRLTLRPRE